MTLESNFVFITPLIEDIFFKLYLIQRVILEVGAFDCDKAGHL